MGKRLLDNPNIGFALAGSAQFSTFGLRHSSGGVRWQMATAHPISSRRRFRLAQGAAANYAELLRKGKSPS